MLVFMLCLEVEDLLSKETSFLFFGARIKVNVVVIGKVKKIDWLLCAKRIATLEREEKASPRIERHTGQ
jgi:hypothetical protein